MASIDSIVSRSVCGVEAVCLIKADGQALVRFVAVEVGQRRRLGVGAGATALLAALDPMQCEHVIDAIAPGLRPYPRLTPESLRATVRLTRRSGFAISQGMVVAGGFGAGLSLPAVGHTPHLALSIAEHASNVTESLVHEWKGVMTQEASRAFADRPVRWALGAGSRATPIQPIQMSARGLL